MYPAQSSARSSDGGALWWREGSPAVLKASQFSTVVFLAQMRMVALIGGSLQFPRDGNCLSILTVPLNPSSLAARYVGTTDDLSVTGVYDHLTAVCLGALLCVSGLSSRATRLATEINNRTVSRETIQELIFFGQHVSGVGSISSQSVTTDLPIDRIVLPTDLALPTFDQPNNVAPANQIWVGTGPADGPAPTPLDASARADNGAIVSSPGSALAPASMSPLAIGATVAGTAAGSALLAWLVWKYGPRVLASLR
jgi:hypothetical protein